MEDLKEIQGKALIKRGVPVRRFMVLAVCVLLTVFGIPQSALAAQPTSLGAVSAATTARVASVSAPMVGGAVPALTVRAGARWGQIDIMLDDVETARVAKSPWAGGVYCSPTAWNAGLFSACLALVTVCAARAYLSSPRARAGITVTVWGYGWCWKY